MPIGARPSQPASLQPSSSRGVLDSKSSAAPRAPVAPSSSSSSSLSSSSSSSSVIAAEEKQRAERERKRKQLEEEAKRVEAEQLKKTMELRKQEAQTAKRVAEGADVQRKMQLMQQQLELDRKAEEEKKELKRIRDEKEAKIKDIAQALSVMEAEYDVTRLQQFCKMIIQIIENVLKNPSEVKYRKIDLSNDKVQRTILRPLGGQVIMYMLGFKEEEGKLVLYHVNTTLLRTELARLQSKLAATSTPIPRCVQQMEAEKVSVETILYVLSTMKTTFTNVITMPDERNFRTIDTSTFAFQRVMSIPPALAIYDNFGFKPTSGGFLVLEKPDVRALEAALNDIVEAVKGRAAQSPIYKAMLSLANRNPEAGVVAMVDTLQPAIRRIMETPDDTKFHKIVLSKFFARSGKLDGGYDFLKLFGFEVDVVKDVAMMPYPPPIDTDLLAFRLHRCTHPITNYSHHKCTYRAFTCCPSCPL